MGGGGLLLLRPDSGVPASTARSHPKKRTPEPAPSTPLPLNCPSRLSLAAFRTGTVPSRPQMAYALVDLWQSPKVDWELKNPAVAVFQFEQAQAYWPVARKSLCWRIRWTSRSVHIYGGRW